MSKVSVIMPAYNAEKYISESIESVLNQSYTDFELLICDDGSTDDTLKIISSYVKKDKRVKLFKNEKNIGNLKTTNFLFEKCQGKYVALQDADDISTLDRFALQVEQFCINEKIGIVGSYFFHIDEKGKVFNCGLLPTIDIDIKNEMDRLVIPILYCAVMVRTDLVRLTGGFKVFFNRKGYADFDWMARISEKCECVNVAKPLYSYRQHGSQFTKNNIINDIVLNNIELLIVEAHKQRLRGEEDFFESNNVIAMRHVICNYYIRRAENLFWEKSKMLEILKSMKVAIIAQPINLRIYRVLFFIIRKRIL